MSIDSMQTLADISKGGNENRRWCVKCRSSIDCPATWARPSWITVIIWAFYNYGQRPRLSWNVNCIQILYDIWIFQKGWRLKGWRNCELCPVTWNTFVRPRLNISFNWQTYPLVKYCPWTVNKVAKKSFHRKKSHNWWLIHISDQSLWTDMSWPVLRYTKQNFGK